MTEEEMELFAEMIGDRVNREGLDVSLEDARALHEAVIGNLVTMVNALTEDIGDGDEYRRVWRA